MPRRDSSTPVFTYRPCPQCGEAGTYFSANTRTGVAWFECPNAHIYTTHTSASGLLLEVKS